MCRRFLRETLKMSNAEDLNRLTACSLVLLGHIFYVLGNHRVSGALVALSVMEMNYSCLPLFCEHAYWFFPSWDKEKNDCTRSNRMSLEIGPSRIRDHGNEHKNRGNGTVFRGACNFSELPQVRVRTRHVTTTCVRSKTSSIDVYN